MSALERRHGDGCECTRCRGFEVGNEHRFQPGHDLSRRHGAYARLELAPAAAETADDLRELASFLEPVDEPAIQLAAFVMERLKRAGKAIDEAEDAGKPERVARLNQDAQGWSRTLLRIFDRLGMTPAGRAELGLHVTAARAQDAALERLISEGRQIRERREARDAEEAEVE